MSNSWTYISGVYFKGAMHVKQDLGLLCSPAHGPKSENLLGIIADF